MPHTYFTVSRFSRDVSRAASLINKWAKTKPREDRVALVLNDLKHRVGPEMYLGETLTRGAAEILVDAAEDLLRHRDRMSQWRAEVDRKG